MRVEFKLALRLGSWGIEFSRDDGFIGLWLGILRYHNYSAYPCWQWRPGWRLPVIMKREQMPSFVCTGIRLVPAEIVRGEAWPDTISE